MSFIKKMTYEKNVFLFGRRSGAAIGGKEVVLWKPRSQIIKLHPDFVMPKDTGSDDTPGE